MRNGHKMLARKPAGKRPLGDLTQRPDNIKWILKKDGMKVWTGFVYLRTGPVATSWEHDNEPSCSAIGSVP
jgi:hypothetical protein